MAYYDLIPIRPGHQFRGALTGVLESFTEVKRMRKTKFLAGVLTAAMLMSTLPMSAFAVDASADDSVKLGKTASWVSGKTGEQANVTLSIEAPASTDPIAVEFVMDATSSLFTDGDETQLAAWADSIVNSLKDKNVYVGLTLFGNDAYQVQDYVKLTSENAAELKEKAESLEILKWLNSHVGTNIEAGIKAGAAKLTAFDGVKAEDKHLVLITDGGAYWWLDREGKPANSTYTTVDSKTPIQAGNELSVGRANANIGAFTLKGMENVDRVPYAVSYDEFINNVNDYPYTDFERGVYFASEALEAAVDQVNVLTVGYKTYYPDLYNKKLYNMSVEFLESADDGAGEAILLDSKDKVADVLKDLPNHLNVAIANNSVITDEIGRGTEQAHSTHDYNFDVAKDQEFVLNVNGTKYTGKLDAGDTIAFGNVATLKYTAPTIEADKNTGEAPDGEKFTLTFHRAIQNGETITLSYVVKLTNPQSTSSKHTVYPNVKATLTHSAIVDGASRAEQVKDFPRPALAYGSSGSSGGGKDPGSTDVLEKDDHYAYVVGYPEDYRTGEPTEDMTRWPVKPQNNITREEVATIFFRLLKDDFRAECWSTDNSFPDVASDRWSNNAVSTAETAGIISGYPDGTFRPSNKITRAEFATIAAQFDSTEYTGADKFTDISGHWASDYINRAAVRGWISGYPDGTFKPNQYITRAEAMTLINAVLDRKPDKDHLHADMIVWPDNLSTAWYYAQVQEATNSHDYEERTSYSEIEIWTKIIPSRDWDSLEDPNNSEYLDSNAGEVVKK